MITHRATTRFIAGGLLCLLAACWAKDADYFTPEHHSTGTSLLDVDPPAIVLQQPTINSILNDNVLRVKIDDLLGSNGATPSGVDPSTVTAVTGAGTHIPLTVSGDVWTGSLNGLPIGPLDLTINATDYAHNFSSFHGSLYYKYQSVPTILLTQSPPATQSSSATSLLFPFSGTIQDPYLSSATLKFTQPGPDAQCNTADDIIWPQGTSPGQISQNPINLLPLISGTGAFAGSYTVYNGVTSGAPRTGTYCATFLLSDNAVNSSGAPAPNVTAYSQTYQVTWSVPFGALSGTVTQLGAPVVGSTVTATLGSTPSTTTTGANGTYSFTLLPPGQWQVSANCPSAANATGSGTVVAGQTTTVNLTCGAPSNLISILTRCTHETSTSTTYAVITTSPAQANAPYSVTVTGPSVVSGGTQSGNLNSSGGVNLQATVGAYGTYTWQAMIAGQTATAQSVVQLTPTNTCQ